MRWEHIRNTLETQQQHTCSADSSRSGAPCRHVASHVCTEASTSPITAAAHATFATICGMLHLSAPPVPGAPAADTGPNPSVRASAAAERCRRAVEAEHRRRRSAMLRYATARTSAPISSGVMRSLLMRSGCLGSCGCVPAAASSARRCVLTCVLASSAPSTPSHSSSSLAACVSEANRNCSAAVAVRCRRASSSCATDSQKSVSWCIDCV